MNERERESTDAKLPSSGDVWSKDSTGERTDTELLGFVVDMSAGCFVVCFVAVDNGATSPLCRSVGLVSK